MQSSFTPVLETKGRTGTVGDKCPAVAQGVTWWQQLCSAPHTHTRTHTHAHAHACTEQRALSCGDTYGPGSQEYDDNLFSGIRGICSHTTSLGARGQEVCPLEPVGTAGMGSEACGSSVLGLFVWVPCVKTNFPSSAGDSPTRFPWLWGTI